MAPYTQDAQHLGKHTLATVFAFAYLMLICVSDKFGAALNFSSKQRLASRFIAVAKARQHLRNIAWFADVPIHWDLRMVAATRGELVSLAHLKHASSRDSQSRKLYHPTHKAHIWTRGGYKLIDMGTINRGCQALISSSEIIDSICAIHLEPFSRRRILPQS